MLLLLLLWHPTAGGTKPQMSNGVWPKAEAADIFNHAHDTVTQVPTNTKLHEAGLGNWYLGGCLHKSFKLSSL
jgi:hypothetical protein